VLIVSCDTETLTLTALLSELDVPVKVAVDVPTDALAAADKITFLEVPGVRVKVAGDADTLAGKPLTCTEICEANPSIAVADTETDVPLFGKTVIVVGLAVKEKSGVAEGDPPPQLTVIKLTLSSANKIQ
jgi:hypothetical protein